MEEIHQKIVEAQIVTEDAERDRMLKVIIRKLTFMLDAIPVDPEVYYYLGYSHYLLLGNSAERSSNIEKYFGKFLELAPANLYGRLYLGHFYFDEEAYQQALDIFTGLLDSKVEFIEKDQFWRFVKLIELIACCCFYLKKYELFASYLEEFLDQYTVSEKDQVAIPLEIAKVYKSMMTLGNEGIGDRTSKALPKWREVLENRNLITVK
jgi:tetratricopeptide (TPR) repeat protein